MNEEKGKNIIIGVLLGVIVILSVTLIFILKGKGNEQQSVTSVDNNNNNNNNNNNKLDGDGELIVDYSYIPRVDTTKLEQIQINENNTLITLNGIDINLKLIDDTLYVNDVIYNGVKFEGTIFVTDYLIYIAPVSECGYGIKYAIDENTNLIIVENNYPLNNLEVADNKLTAEVIDCHCYENDDNKCNDSFKVEFAIGMDSIRVMEIN